MKTPEDEAFDDIERRQGGGFPAKRAMAADKLQEPEREALKLAKDVLLRLINLTNHDDYIYEAVDKCEAALAQPAQEPKREWVGLTDEERQDIALEVPMDAVFITEAKLKEKNT